MSGPNEIVVTVRGRSGSGKTTVAILIEKVLREHGFTNVSFDDPEHTASYLISTQADREKKCKDVPIKVEMAHVR
jgi:uridine kinase